MFHASIHYHLIAAPYLYSLPLFVTPVCCLCLLPLFVCYSLPQHYIYPLPLTCCDGVRDLVKMHICSLPLFTVHCLCALPLVVCCSLPLFVCYSLPLFITSVDCLALSLFTSLPARRSDSEATPAQLAEDEQLMNQMTRRGLPSARGSGTASNSAAPTGSGSGAADDDDVSLEQLSALRQLAAATHTPSNNSGLAFTLAAPDERHTEAAAPERDEPRSLQSHKDDEGA